MMKSDALKFEIGVHTSTGTRLLHDGQPRPNVDRYLIKQFPAQSDFSEQTTLLVVADTFGSPYEGSGWDSENPPAQIAIDMILQAFEREQSIDIPTRLANSFQEASLRIHQFPLAGASCVAIVIQGEKLYLAACGECRSFLLRNNAIQKISLTHTIEEGLLHLGQLTVDDLMTHPIKSVTYRMLGIENENGLADLRLRLSPDDDDETALSNQGTMLLLGDQLVLTSGHVFGHFIRPDDMKNFTDTFFDKNHSAQQAVDQFMLPLRQRNDFSDLTMIAVRLS